MKLEKGDFARYAEVDREQMEVNARNDFRPAGSTCVHAQQYVEKMLKAKLLEKGIQYPRKHDLVSLLELFDDKEMLDRHIEDAANLSDYATAFRYERRVPSVEEMEAAFISAQSIVRDVCGL